jgi:hypothetical protein
MALLYLIVGFVELINGRPSIRCLSKKAVLISLPLVLMITPWVIRNFQVMNRFIIFQQDMYAGYAITEGELTIRKTLNTLGEEGGIWWNKKAAASYFSRRSLGTSKYTYPSYIKNNPVTFAKFESFRKVSLDSTLSSKDVKNKAASIISYYKSAHPVRFYFINHIKPIIRFLIHNGSYRLPMDINKPLEFMIKLSQSLLYYCYLILGSIGLIILTSKNKRNSLFLLPTIYLIFLFPVFLGLSEWRYFLPFYLFHQLGVLYLINNWYKKNKGTNRASIPKVSLLKPLSYAQQ